MATAERPTKAHLEQYEKLLSGGLAGACAKTLTAPIDRVKLLYQVDPSKAFSVQDALRRTARIAKDTGVLSLWRGNGLAMIHVIPYGALVYMTFDNYHTFLVDTVQVSPMPARFVAGSAAGATATMVAYPLDLLRARIMAHVGRNDKYQPGIFGALSDISRREGLGSLWRGLNPTLVGIVPYAGISFCLFETAKVWVKESLGLGSDAEIPTVVRLCTGATAGLIAQSVTYPLHVVRRRMQIIEQPLPLAVASEAAAAEAAAARAVGGSTTVMAASSARGAVERAASAFARAAATPAAAAAATLAAAQAVHGEAAAAAVSGPSAASVATAAVSRAPKLCARHYASVGRAIVHIARTEGFSNGLFKGLMLTWLKAPLTTALGFTVNDRARDFFARRKAAHAAEGGQAAGGAHALEKAAALTSAVVAVGAVTGSSTAAGGGTAAGGEDRAAGGEPAAQRAAAEAAAPAHRLTSIELLCCGSIAGACAKTVIAPGDRIKIIFQTDPARHFSMGNALRAGRQIVATSGPLALWRGNGATMVRIMPHAGIVYMSFDRYNTALRTLVPDVPAASQRFLAGAAAGATATALTYPLDLMRARMAIDMSRDGSQYASMWHAGSKVVRSEGWGALYSGITPTLLGVMPYAGLSFAVFETLKAAIRTRWDLKTDHDLPTYARLSVGGIAGLIAQSATYPLDIVRRRMQVGPAGGAQALSWVALMRRIIRTEGLICGLYKGLSMNWIKSPIAIAVSFTVNDNLKYYLVKRVK